MNEHPLLGQFESAQLHPFTHYEHIHVAWAYLRRDGWERGYANIQRGLKHFAAAHGQSTKYHETITRFWALVIQHAINTRPEIDDFEAFVEAFPLLLDKTILTKHFSADVLKSELARNAWHAPDLIPMPAL